MGIALGLLAAAFYGAADFLGGLATKRTSMFAVTILSQGVGFALLLAVVPFFPAHVVPVDYLWGALGGLCGGLGLALLYHALSIGKMGVVSPITAVLAASLPVVVGVVRGERLATLQMAGMVVALVAIVLISLSTEEDGRIEVSTAGVKEAVASGVILGGFYTFLALGGKGAGLYPLLGARCGSIALLVAVALVLRRPMVPSRATVPTIVLAGAIDMTANALYVLATFRGYLSVVAVLTSLYPASTVFLARVVLRERLQLQQKIGVACALAGVVMIAL